MRVSIGIPFFNAKATLGHAIRSIFAQTFDDWELILVNDGSTDGSIAIAEAVQDRRVRVLNDGQNRGLVYRLNQLVSVSRGEYIARMDDDDIMHPTRLEKQLAYLDSHPQVDLVGSSVYTIGARNEISGIRLLSTAKLSAQHILARVGIIHPSVTGRAAWFRQNPYDARFVRAEDHELWCRTFSQSTFHITAEPLLFYRECQSRTIRKYVRSGRSNRHIFALYGPQLVGWPSTVALMAHSLFKDAAYCALTLSGFQHVALQYSRGTPSAEERDAGMRALAHVRSTAIPGIDTAARAVQAG